MEAENMKKYLPYANYLAAGAGVLAALLRQWTLVAGRDKTGLYPAAHPGWIGYLLVMAAAVVVIYLMTRNCGKNGTCQALFPAGIFPVLGQLAATSGIVVHCLPLLQSNRMGLICGILGFCAAGALLVLSWQRFQQKPPFAPAYLLPCLFFAMQLFLMGKQYSTETQLLCFLPQFLACAASALASYELMGCSAEDGSRQKSLFWSLSAAALCFAATPGASWMYAAVGLWHLLGHCSLAEPTEELPKEETVEEIEETDL